MTRADLRWLFVACLLVAGLLATLVRSAFSQVAPTIPRTRAQGVMLARVIASEDTRVLRDREPGCKVACGTSGALTRDAHLIARTVEVYAERKRVSYDAALRALAPHVTRAQQLTRPRQAWTSTLPAKGREQPAGWVSARDGNWRSFAENWASLRENVVEAWLGGEFIGPDIVAWGTREDFERNRVARNLCEVDCTECANVFAVRCSVRIVAAAAARGY